MARSLAVDRRAKGVVILAGVLLLLTACQSGAPGGLRPIPTAAPTHLSAVQTPTPTPPTTPTPWGTPPPLVTLPPALALPDASGTTISCEANTLRIPLGESGGRVSAVSRIAASGDSLFLLIDGGLYRALILAVDAGAPNLEPVMLPGDEVAGRPVQELLDLAVDPGNGLVYVLDKIGHVFRYEPAGKRAAITYRAAPTEDEPDNLPYDFVALTVDGRGGVTLLDAAHGVLWTPAGLSALEEVSESRGLTSSTDVAYAGNRFYTLQQNGTIRRARAGAGSEEWRDAQGTRLGLSLFASSHLGIELLYSVDGLRREIDGLLPGSGEAVTRHTFAFPGMGLLRDAVFAGGRLYAVADTDLYVYPGPAGEGGSTDCAAVSPARPTLYSFDVLTLLQGATYPIQGGTLPPWPRVYPGASRIYRMGVHRGLDIYSFNAPRGFDTGYPVIAAAAGTVRRATIFYDDMTEEEFEAMLREAEAAGVTPPDILERLEGIQVILDHGNGVQTVYAHLDQVAPGVVTGAQVRAGQVIGSVGVTGTQGESRPGTVAPHLHFEVWLGDRYLGFGITARETMWWFASIFPASEE